MKPTKLIFSALVIVQALCGSASAQSVTAHTLAPSDVEHVIVKSYTYPATITSCNFSDPNIFRSMFIYSGANQQGIQIMLDGYRVNDFAIDKDTVFFCGQSRNGYGIIGFFDIQDLFFNSGSFKIQDYFDVYDGYTSTFTRPVENLTKMVTYRMTGQKRHIVSIGYAKDILSEGIHYGSIVDLYLDAYWSYNSGTIYKSDIDCFKDITLAGDYVVTAGFEFPPNISMRLFKADDLFSPTGPQNSARVFIGPDQWDNEDLLLTTLSNGALPAVATAAKLKKDYLEGYKPIHIATYDVFMLVTGSSSSMTGSAVMNVSDYDLPLRLYDFITDRHNDCFILAHLGENRFFQQCSILSKIKLNLQSVDKSTLAIRGCNDIYHRGLQSIDKYNSHTQYVFAGVQSDDSHELTYNVETAGQEPVCQPTKKCFIDIYTLVPAQKLGFPIEEYSRVIEFSTIQRHDTLALPVIIECNTTNGQ